MAGGVPRPLTMLHNIPRLARRRLHGCCHIPESTSASRAAAAQRPELWENRAERSGCREHAFEFDVARTRYGRGVLAEVGETAKALGLRRVAVVTDKIVARQSFFAEAMKGMRDAGVEAIVFDKTMVEPTDQSFLAAASWAADVRPDGWVSIGGGSCIDTAKAANLFATHPPPAGLDDFLHYVNAPVGRAAAVPGPLKPHIACPTTAGTGSEGTGYAICDISSLGVKTALANRALKPTQALVDPLTTHFLPRSVVAASGMDVVMHGKSDQARSTQGLPSRCAVASLSDPTLRLSLLIAAAESFSARPYFHRPLGAVGAPRPLNQGQNPWLVDAVGLEYLNHRSTLLVSPAAAHYSHCHRPSTLPASLIRSDIGCRETLRIAGRYFARALEDENDTEAREAMHWAATLAGTALNNAGTALPHGCSYPVSGGVKQHARRHYAPAAGSYANRTGGPTAALLPHGYAVAVMAPAAFATTAAGTPERHLEAAALLGSHAAASTPSSGRRYAHDECGALLGEQIAELVRRAGDCPMSLAELGFVEEDIPAMVQGTIVQQRVLSIVPVPVDEEVLAETFRRAIAGFR